MFKHAPQEREYLMKQGKCKAQDANKLKLGALLHLFDEALCQNEYSSNSPESSSNEDPVEDEDDDEDDYDDTEDITELYKIELRKLFWREKEKCAPFLDVKKWEPFSCGNVISTQETNAKMPTVDYPEVPKETLDDVVHQIDQRGFCMVKSEAIDMDWGEHIKLFERIEKTMDKLKAAGWPPVFVFLFDEPWQLIDNLFGLVAPVLGDDCLLDASVYAWALTKPHADKCPDRSNRSSADSPPAAGGDSTAGAASGGSSRSRTSGQPERDASECSGNFALPHRDSSFADVNFPDGRPNNLSVWVCVNDVGTDNGCMYVVPKDVDERFDKSEDYYHMRSAYSSSDHQFRETPKEQTTLNFPLDKIVPLPAPRGSVLCWQGNLIHWGSSCSPSSTRPARRSIAMSFRVSAARMPVSEHEISCSGRAPMTRQEVRNLTLEDRLSIVAKALIMYCHWFPNFASFDPSLIGVDLSSLNSSSGT